MFPILMCILSDVAFSYPIAPNRVDLSYVIDNSIPRWPAFNAFSMRVAHNRQENFTSQVETIETITHIGTHIDAPVHFKEGGWTVDQIPPERLSGPAVVVDVQNKTEGDPSYEVTVEDLVNFENTNGEIPPKSFVLIFTGLGRYWNNTKKYLGTDLGLFDGLAFPGVSGDATDWLIEKRDILGIGLDSLSLDSSKEQNFTAHVKLLGADKIAIENIANLDKLPTTGTYLDVFPLKVRGASGGPAQVNAYF